MFSGVRLRALKCDDLLVCLVAHATFLHPFMLKLRPGMSRSRTVVTLVYRVLVGAR